MAGVVRLSPFPECKPTVQYIVPYCLEITLTTWHLRLFTGDSEDSIQVRIVGQECSGAVLYTWDEHTSFGQVMVYW